LSQELLDRATGSGRSLPKLFVATTLITKKHVEMV
jgi:hypothetical protein